MSGISKTSEGRLLPCNQDIGEGVVMKIKVRILVDHYDFRAGTEEYLIPAVVNYLVSKNIAFIL